MFMFVTKFSLCILLLFLWIFPIKVVLTSLLVICRLISGLK